MKLPAAIITGAAVTAVLSVGFVLLSPRHHQGWDLTKAVTWQHMVTPGELSQPHAFLESNCGACHTPVKGVEANNCIVCHANDQELLQREPTSFHADVQNCSSCHFEHRGRSKRTAGMDHAVLARIGFKQSESQTSAATDAVSISKRWLVGSHADTMQGLPHLHPGEAALKCATCHQTKDRHRGYFGSDCAQCHETQKWTIPEFRHPSATSTECVQCHQAPPSHYMMHFHMVSMMVAGKPHADVTQCFLCHQTTSWNDIKGVGFYKHH